MSFSAIPRLAGLGFLALSLAACSPDSPAVAKVNTQAISLQDFERQLVIYHSVRPNAVLDDATKRSVLEQMANQAMLTQEAQKAGLEDDANVKAAMEAQRQSVRKELRATMANARAQLEQLDTAVEQKILIDRLLAQRQASLSPSDAELKEAYQARKAAAKGQPLASYQDLLPQLRQQVEIDKLLSQIQGSAKVEIYPEVAARAATPQE